MREGRERERKIGNWCDNRGSSSFWPARIYASCVTRLMKSSQIKPSCCCCCCRIKRMKGTDQEMVDKCWSGVCDRWDKPSLVFRLFAGYTLWWHRKLCSADQTFWQWKIIWKLKWQYQTMTLLVLLAIPKLSTFGVQRSSKSVRHKQRQWEKEKTSFN